MESNNMTDVAKIMEIVGSSDKSWEDAAQANIFSDSDLICRCTFYLSTDRSNLYLS
jgi:flavin-binding protein dodecin